MVAGCRQVVEKLLDARLMGNRLERIRSAGGRLGGVLASQPVDMVHLLGSCVIRLQFLVGDRPGWGDAVVMPQLAKILLPEAIQGCTEHLRGAADEIVYLRLERSTVAVVPGVGRDVAVLYEDCCRIPVLRLALKPVAALENQDVLPRGGELPGERAATCPAAYDDDVEALIHISLRLETGAAMHDAAIREDGRRGEIACAVAGEEPDDGGNLLRARHAPQRYRRI